jgi:hypothetical protein
VVDGGNAIDKENKHGLLYLCIHAMLRNHIMSSIAESAAGDFMA